MSKEDFEKAAEAMFEEARSGKLWRAPDGTPIDVEEFAKLVRDPEVKWVGDDTYPGGRVATIYTGMDMDGVWRRLRDPEAPPLIYETMVFRGANAKKQTTNDYFQVGEWPTRERAEAEHAKAVAALWADPNWEPEE